MNISVIFTGGTIGSVQKEAWVGIDDATQYTLLQPFEKKYKDVCFKTGAPYSILSENLSASELNLLQEELDGVLKNKPDGIIITHGTDTIQYTAAAIEFAYGNVDIPVVFVSADYPLEDPASNGYINFEAAVEFIRKGTCKGIYVSYKNEDTSYVDIHVASRLLQHGERSANLYSLDNCVCAVYEQEVKVLSCVESVPAPSVAPVTYIQDAGILTVESRPGNYYGYALNGVRAILLKPYHSATLNTDSEAFVEFCKKAAALQIPIFIANVPKGEQYESSKYFDDLGICVAPYSTYVSLYMKLWRGISLGADLKESVMKPICHEICS